MRSVGRGVVWSWVLLAGIVLAGCNGGGSEEDAGGELALSPAVAAERAAPAPAPRRVELAWPTPNQAFLRGEGPEGFVQPTESGLLISGLYGSVRNGGRQFHEGLDLFPLERDRAGEALDPVFAVLDGVVRHVSARAGASSYGRYVVLEHPAETPAVYTLYAHLGRIEPGLVPGVELTAGARIGIMGRSAGGYVIPKERAHLHFEIGLRMTDQFERWYHRRGFGSPNEHGLWNGMNLMGLDPLEFLRRTGATAPESLLEVIDAQPRALRLRVAGPAEPDFARRYPALVAGGEGAPPLLIGGWELELGASGAPLRLRPLGPEAFTGWRRGEVRILEVDTSVLAANRGRKLVRTVRGGPAPDEDLATVLQQLFSILH